MDTILSILEEIATSSTTLFQYCQKLETVGIHPEVTTFNQRISGIAYQVGEWWFAGKKLHPRFSLHGLQQIGIQVSQEDLALLKKSNNVYQDRPITPPVKRVT
jgi:hypothetical protein